MRPHRAFVFILTVLSLSGCGSGGRSSTLIEYVPADSVAVVVIRWAAVQKDDDLRQMMKADALDGQIRRFSLDPGEVKDLVVFSAFGDRAALLIRAPFNERDLVEHLKSSGWKEVRLAGKKAYQNGADYLAVVMSGILAAGTDAGVTALIDVEKGEDKGIASTASFKQINEGLARRNAAINGYLLAPEGTLEAADAALSVTAGAMSLFGMGGLGAILKKLNIAAGTGIAISEGSTRQKFAVDFCALMRDEGSATVAAGGLKLMQGLANFAGRPEDKENLKGFGVTQNKKLVSMKMEMPRAALMPPTSSGSFRETTF